MARFDSLRAESGVSLRPALCDTCLCRLLRSAGDVPAHHLSCRLHSNENDVWLSYSLLSGKVLTPSYPAPGEA